MKTKQLRYLELKIRKMHNIIFINLIFQINNFTIVIFSKMANNNEHNIILIPGSDSKLTVYDLTNRSWRTIGSVPWLSTFSTVSLAELGQTHLIAFGSNLDQDGAILVVYNIELGVGSCKYPMKMYCENAKLYCFNQRIILEASNHIGVLPYVLEPKRNLSNLLGSHEVILDDQTEIADWGTPTQPLYPFDDRVQELIKSGLTERSICGQLIPTLLEKGNIRNIIYTIQKYRDISESTLVSLLKYGIKSVQTNMNDYTNFEEFLISCNENSAQIEFEFLNSILSLSFSDALIIPHMRNILGLDDTLFLMNYICYLVVDPDLEITVEFESKLFDWCMLLIDAFYQQYLIMKDEKVSLVLENLLNIVNKFLNNLENINKLLPKLNKILAGKDTTDDVDHYTYAIELMQI